MKIALISCSKDKQDHTCTAKEMYSKSTLFKKASSYVQSKGYDKWFILSAKYGLLDPEQVIDTYNVTLNTMSAKEVQEWSTGVSEQLKGCQDLEIDFYAGGKYRKYLIPLLEERGMTCAVPLKGMGIGQQLSFYTQQSKEQ